MPSAVLGSAPRPKQAATTKGESADPTAGEPAIDGLPTMGADVDQMLIFTGQLALEVDFAATAETIDSAVAIGVAAGGYVAQMTDTTLQLRVPSKNFRYSMHELQELGDVRSRNVQALDVSEEFNDLEVRLDNLRATRKRIEKLLGQSKDLAQILIVEKELQRVTGEIDQIEGRMRLLSSQAAFSTIAMAFAERPEDRELILADDPPPPAPKANPRMLKNSAPWVGQVGIHNLLSFND